MALQTDTGIDEALILRQDPSHPITGHGIGLAHAIDDHQPLCEICKRRESDGVLSIGIEQLIVDFVGKDIHVRILAQDSQKRLQFGMGIHRAGRVIGRAEDDETRLGSKCLTQFPWRQAIAVLKGRLNRNYRSFG